MDFELNEYFEPVPAAERELVPEGEHQFRITQVVEDQKRLRVDLAHDDRRFGLVFADLPKGPAWAGRIVAELAAALWMDAAAWKAATSDAIKGRRVVARVYHKVGNSGRTFVNVGGFSPAADDPATSRPPARRTPTQKAEAVSALPADDIPF